MNPQKKKLKIFEGCIPVRGYSRSVIYDLNRNDYDFIPNHLHDFLIKTEKQSLDESSHDNDLIKGYLDFLIEKDYIFFCEKEELDLFPPLSLKWDFPAHITSAAIEVGEIWTNDTQKITLRELKKVYCRHIQLYSLHNHRFEFFQTFLEKIYESGIRSAEIILPFYQYEKEKLSEIILKNRRLVKLTFYNAPITEAIQIGEHSDICCSITENLCLEGCHDLGYFKVNTEMFSESIKHNVFFNRKVFIDSECNVKNAPGQKESFGNIRKQELTDIIQKLSFQKLWSANKNETDICRDCELRHMCFDPRIPKQRENGTWFHEKECNYNPYIAKWKGEKEYLSLSESGITVNNNEQSYDYKKLENILFELYD